MSHDTIAGRTTDEIYQQVQVQQPALLYLTGKTCTGKTTFSSRLGASCNYEIVELDRVVHDAIVQPQGLQSVRGDVFVSVYKTADNGDWVDLFAAKAQSRINSLLAQNKKVIVDGAIVNIAVVHRVFDSLPHTMFVYFHPALSSKNYLRNLTSRFKGATLHDRNGLPNTFWTYIGQDSFRQFCEDKTMTPQLEQGISNYAQRSSRQSAERLKTLQKDYSSVSVVEI